MRLKPAGDLKPKKSDADFKDRLEWLASHNLTIEQFDAVAKRIRAAYSRLKFDNRESVDSSAAELSTCWYAAAIKCITADAEPETWVEAQFSGNAGTPVFPSTLSAKDSVKVYNTYIATAGKDVEQALVSYAQIFNTLKSNNYSVAEILRLPAKFDSLFIYCAAKAYELPDIAEQHKQRAKSLYAFNAYKVAYNKLFKKYLHELDN